MKVRKFYPRSAMHKLAGENTNSLTRGEAAALEFALRRGRKVGLSVVLAQTKIAAFNAATPEQAQIILANTNRAIKLHMAQP